MKPRLIIVVVFTLLMMLVACASKADLDSALSQVKDLDAQLAALMEESESTISSLEDQFEEKTTEVQTLQTDLEDVQDELNEVKSAKVSLSLDNVVLKAQVNQMVCEDQIDGMKYENILDASTILSAWWARRSNVDRVQGAYRDSIWSNADTKIHGIRYIGADDNQPYVEHFLVYFDEFGWKPGVFWVSGQCWLDVP